MQKTSPEPPKTETRQKKIADFTSARVKKELEEQMKEISATHEPLTYQQVPCLEDKILVKICLHELLKSMTAKQKEHLKENSEIGEEIALAIKQDEILEDMQTKLNSLEEQLKKAELTGFFQTSPEPPKTETRQKKIADFTSARVKKELEEQMKEISAAHEPLTCQQVPCLEDKILVKICLHEMLKSMTAKQKEHLKENSEIGEEIALAIKQDEILEDMQTKLNSLEEQLKKAELTGLKFLKQLQNQTDVSRAGSRQQGENVDSCPSSPAQKMALAPKSTTGFLKKCCFCLGRSLGLLGMHFLGSVCCCMALTWCHGHFSDALLPCLTNFI